jgi:hypothetical protein
MANREEISSDLTNKSNNINKLSEFYPNHINLKEYLLSVDKEEHEEDFRFKLIDYSLNKNYTINDLKYIYLFGLLPCDLLPGAYIPLNYKNHNYNFSRLTKDDTFAPDKYSRIYDGYSSSSANPKTFTENTKRDIIKRNLKNILTKIDSDKTLYYYDYSLFTISLFILWSFVILNLMYVIFYYNSEIFNYALVGIIIISLIIAIIWKMIYTIQYY